MAEVVTTEPASEPALAREPPSRERSPHRGRFLLAYAVLGSLAGVALVAGAGLLEDSTKSVQQTAPPPTWSEWYPTAGGLARANQIAQYVSRRYRLPSGDQLVGVRAGPLSVQNLRVTAIALRKDSQTGEGEDFDVIPAEQSVAYVLCGFGDDCSIPEGKPTSGRERLLRREALELALYTFQYMNVDSVVAFLPPRPDSDPTWSFLFRRESFRDELERPLRFTIPENDPPLPGKMTPIEVRRIDRLTEPARYRFDFARAQNEQLFLVLDPPNLEEGNGG